MKTMPNVELLHLLHRASQVADALFERECAGSELTARQLIILAAIAADEGQSQSALVERTGVDRSTLSDVTARLQGRGLVKRRRRREDARAYSVSLTAAGRKQLEASLDCAVTVEALLLGTLPRSHRKEFVDQLQAIVAHTNSEPLKTES